MLPEVKLGDTGKWANECFAGEQRKACSFADALSHGCPTAPKGREGAALEPNAPSKAKVQRTGRLRVGGGRMETS